MMRHGSTGLTATLQSPLSRSTSLKKCKTFFLRPPFWPDERIGHLRPRKFRKFDLISVTASEDILIPGSHDAKMLETAVDCTLENEPMTPLVDKMDITGLAG